MKKLIFILICFSLLTFGSSARIIEVAPAGAWGIGLIGGGAPPPAGGGQAFTDAFAYSDGELASVSGGNWTKLDGTNASLASNQVTLEDVCFYEYTGQALDTDDGYACVRWVDDPSNSAYGGIRFRSDGGVVNKAYVVRWESNAEVFAWRYCTASSSCTTFGSTKAHTLDDGDLFCIEWDGADAATEVKMWDMGGGAMPARGTGHWADAADLTWNDPGENAVNAGTGVGLYNGAAGDIVIDDFYAGDQ